MAERRYTLFDVTGSLLLCDGIAARPDGPEFLECLRILVGNAPEAFDAVVGGEHGWLAVAERILEREVYAEEGETDAGERGTLLAFERPPTEHPPEDAA